MRRDQVQVPFFDPKGERKTQRFQYHWLLGNLTELMLSENFAYDFVVLILRCHLDILILSQFVTTCGFNISCFGTLGKYHSEV